MNEERKEGLCERIAVTAGIEIFRLQGISPKASEQI